MTELTLIHFISAFTGGLIVFQLILATDDAEWGKIKSKKEFLKRGLIPFYPQYLKFKKVWRDLK